MVQRVSLQIVVAILFTGAFVLLTVAITLALTPALGAPLACVLVAAMLGLAGGGILLGMERMPKKEPTPSQTDPVARALIELVATTLAQAIAKRRD